MPSPRVVAPSWADAADRCQQAPPHPSSPRIAAFAPTYIARARLQAVLDVPVPVTVLRAPAGFGKTVLLRSWCKGPVRAAWLTARPGMAADPRRWPVIGDALTATDPVTVIIDDADALADRTVDDLVGLFRFHADRGHRLVLAGRCDSLLANRAHHDVCALPIGADQMLFTVREVADLLAQTIPDLGTGADYWAEKVHRSTGGWPEVTAAVALRMAAAAKDPVMLSAVACRAAIDMVRSPLLAELQRLNAVELALVTAVAGRFSAELLGSATGRPVPAQTLEALVANGVLGGENTSGETIYSWPEASRAVLAAELDARDPARVPTLHSQWARGCLAHGLLRDAVRHMVAAQDWPLLVETVESEWRALMHDDDPVVRESLLAIPREAAAGSLRTRALREVLLSSDTPVAMPPPAPPDGPRALPSLPARAADLADLAAGPRVTEALDCALLAISAHRRRGRHAAALEYARRLSYLADLAHATRPGLVARHRPAVALSLAVGHLLTGDFTSAIPALESVHGHGITGPEPAARFAAVGAASMSAMLHALTGDVTTARLWRTRLTGIDARRADYGRAVVHLHVASAVADLLIAVDEQNDPDAEAADQRLKVLDPAGPWLDLWAFVCVARAHYALHRGDVHAGLDGIVKARSTHRHDLGEGVAGPLLAAAEANLLIAADRANQARELLGHTTAHPLLRLPAARLALVAGDSSRAIDIASDRGWWSGAGTRERVEMGLVCAVAAHREGRSALAAESLDRAVRTAREAGLRSAWDTVPRAELAEIVGHVPGAFEVISHPAAAQPRRVFPTSAVLVELTRRERAVLDELAAGSTLQRIAAALTVSHNTVKTHVGSIYRKLAVDDRESAVTTARRLGLIDARS